jgi:hypothetical protein
MARLPALTEAAGAPPESFGEVAGANLAVLVPERLPAFSRRRLADIARPAAVPRAMRARGRSAPAKLPALTSDETAAILFRHRADLAPVLAKCGNDEHRARVAAAFQLLQNGPSDSSARSAWMRVLRELEPTV